MDDYIPPSPEDFSTLKRAGKPSDEDILRRSKERATLAIRYWTPMHDQARDELNFYLGNQWSDRAAQLRANSGRPMHTYNLLPQLLNIVLGDILEQPPDIQLMAAPKGKGAAGIKNSSGEEVSQIDFVEGLIRYIIYNGKAIQHFKKAAEHIMTAGFAWLRVREGYLSETSFEKNLMIECLDDRWNVFVDPSATQQNYDDANWIALDKTLSREDFEQIYGDETQPSSFLSLYGSNDYFHDHAKKHDEVHIVEYFERNLVDAILVEYELPVTRGGRRRTRRFLDSEEMNEEIARLESFGCVILRKKWAKCHQVRWYHISEDKILKQGMWKGTRLPFVFVPGRETQDTEGKRLFKSLFTDVQDAQRMINYYATAISERMQTGQKDTWLATTEQTDGHEECYEFGGQYGNAVTYYNAQDNDSTKDADKPDFVKGTDVPHAEMQSLLTFENLLRTGTGINEAKLGQRSNETSGRAIMARQQQGDIATFEFVSNMREAVSSVGRLALELLPLTYDQNTMFNIMDIEHGIEEVDMSDYDSVEILSAEGAYVRVTAGRSFVTIYERLSEVLAELVKRDNPAFMPLLMQNLQASGAPQFKLLARRLMPFMPRESLTEQEKASMPEPEPTPEQQIQQEQAKAEQMKAEAETIKAQADLLEAQNRAKELEIMGTNAMTPELDKAIERKIGEVMGSSRSAGGKKA